MSETPDICFRCKQSGHFASKCPTKQQKSSTAEPPVRQQRPVPQVIHSIPTPVQSINHPIKKTFDTPSISSASVTESAPAAAGSDICYRCKQSGHLASKCPTKKRKLDDDAPTQSFVAKPAPQSISQPIVSKPIVSNPVSDVVTKPVPSDAVCYRCKAVGEHLAKDCPTKKPKVVAAPVPSEPADDSRACYKCHQKGHMSRECTAAPVTKTAKPGKSFVPSDDTPSIKPKCYRCYAPDHTTVDCPLPKPCHYCQSTEHLAAACVNKKQILRDRNSEAIKDVSCSKCYSLGHIARYCPQDVNRIVLRDETKPRALTCYICDESSHHAVECPRLQELKDRMIYLIANPANLDSKMEDLLHLCARALDYNSAVYVHDRMCERKHPLTPAMWEALESLNAKSGKTHTMDLPEIQAIRRSHGRIKDLLTAHRLQIQQSNNQPLLERATKFLSSQPQALTDCANRFALCKILVTNLSWSAKQARDTVATLAKRGHLIESKKSIVFQPIGLTDEEMEAQATRKTAQAETEKKAKAKKAKKLKEKTKKQAKKENDGTLTTTTTVTNEPMEVDVE